MKCYIIYGSESLLLKPFINNIDEKSICIRIYNNKIPHKRINFFDFKFDEDLFKQMNSLLEKKNDQIDKIIFIGAASTLEKKLFLSNDKYEVERILNINIKNYLSLVSNIIPFMMKKKKGSFIYLSSFRAIKPTKGTLLYSSTKSFCETFFKGIGREYRRFNITTHIIRMGAFDGKMLHNLGDEYIKKVNKHISLGRNGSAEELSNIIDFCEKNVYTTTGVVEANGGLNMET